MSSDAITGWPETVAFQDDLTPAQWIRKRLMSAGTGGGTVVGSVVPTGFPAYVRVLHPVATDHDLIPGRWEAFVRAGQLVYHPLIQWDRLDRQSDIDSGASPAAPVIGKLSIGLRNALMPHLAGETATPNGVYFGVWEGWAALSRGSASDSDPSRNHPPCVPAMSLHYLVSGHPRFEHEYRSYFLGRGAISDLLRFPSEVTPSLIWPEDRAFCCATEIDFDSTLVGLSEAGAEQMLNDDGLEALRVRVDDRLDIGGDTLNPEY